MLSLSCPSCNTAFALPAIPADRRAECPRCHDVFPIRGAQETGDTGQEAGSPSAASPAAFQSPISNLQSPRWSLKRSLLVALALGLLGLGIGLWVYRDRGGKPPEGDPRAQRPADVARPATELEGLRYLPADTNLAFAAQPGPFLAHAERTKQDSRELLKRAGLPDRLLGVVTDLGLTLPQIDHFAGGAYVGGSGELRLTLVLVLRGPLADEDEFLRKLKAKKAAGGKSRYDVDLPGFPVNVVLARVSPTVWVFALALGKDPAANLEAAERGGHEPGGKQFRPWLAEAITSRLPPDAALWVATNDERWADKPAMKAAAALLKLPDLPSALSQGRAGLAAVSLGEEPRVRLFVKAADDATGQRVRNYFRSLATDPKASHGGAGDSALYESPIDPATASATLRKILADAGRK